MDDQKNKSLLFSVNFEDHGKLLFDCYLLLGLHSVYTILWWLPPKSLSELFNSGLKGLRGLKVGVSCVVLLWCPPGLFMVCFCVLFSGAVFLDCWWCFCGLGVFVWVL